MVLRKPFLVELEFGNVGFKEDGEKPDEREKTSRDKVGIQQLTQPRYGGDTGSRTQATLVGGARSHHFVTLSSDEAVRPL